MPKYVLNRDYELVSKLGASVNFKKGVPTFAPIFLDREIKNLGGEMVEDDEKPTDDDTGDKTPATAEEREMALMSAFEAIVTGAKKEDMTKDGKGHPTQKALTREMGWTPEAGERDAAWAKYVAGKQA